MICPSCAADIADGAHFCSNCGTALAHRDERRIATVIFGDLVGFTGLSENLDPERVKNVVDGCFQALRVDIENFGGLVDKVVGDAIVALFGAPTAHADDAERAVRAALRMQETVAEYAAEHLEGLQMRIGVNTGEVLVGAIAADGDYTAMGDVVNTASRLQEIAEPGTVLVGRETHAATTRAIDYEDAGLTGVRGRNQPVSAFRAIAAIGLPGQHDRDEGPLVGRAIEFRSLATALDAALTTNRAHLLLIQGDTGMGKSRLAIELTDRASRLHNAFVIEGRCLPYGEANVWFPIVDALRDAFGLSENATRHEAEQRLTSGFSFTFDAAPDDPIVHRATLGGLHLLGFDTQLQDLDPLRAQDEAMRAVRSGLQVGVMRGPLVIRLADLHWADDVVLEFLDSLLQRLANQPFVIVASARHTVSERWVPRPGRSNVVSVSLDPLDAAASRRLLQQMIKQPLDPSVQDEIVSRSGGIPFFLRELGLLVSEEGPEALSSVPSSIRGLIAARLDTLDDTERKVVENASVLGLHGPVMGLGEMSKRLDGYTSVADAVLRLTEKDIFVLDHGIWSFRSELVRDVAYGRLTKSSRAARHAGVARYMDDHYDPRQVTNAVAHHYRRAAALAADVGRVQGVPDDIVSLAVHHTLEAAATLQMTDSPALAAQSFTEALGFTSNPDDRRSLLLARAQAMLKSYELTDAEKDVHAALAVGDAPADVQAIAATIRGEIAQGRTLFGEALVFFGEALAIYERLGDYRGIGEARRLQGMAALLIGRSDEAEASLLAALDAYRTAGDRSGEATVRQNLAWVAFALDDTAAAERRILASIELFTELNDLAGVSFGRGLLAHVRMFQGRREESRRLAAQTLAEARERGDRWSEGVLLGLRASLDLWAGHADKAVEQAEEAWTIFRNLDDPVGKLQTASILGRALVHAGRSGEGFGLFAGAAERDTRGERGIALLLSTAAASSAVMVGDPDGALQWLHGTDLETLDVTTLAGTDRAIAYGMASAQLNDLDAARVAIGLATKPNPQGEQRANAWAAMALTQALAGDTARATDCLTVVDTCDHATYLDHQLALLASIIIAVRQGRADHALALSEEMASLIEPTSDRMAELLLRIVQACVHARLETDQAESARERADRLARLLGIGSSAWGDLVVRGLS